MKIERLENEGKKEVIEIGKVCCDEKRRSEKILSRWRLFSHCEFFRPRRGESIREKRKCEKAVIDYGI